MAAEPRLQDIWYHLRRYARAVPSIEDRPGADCQYHIIQIVRRHLTSKPDLEASVQLLRLVMRQSRIPEDVFRTELTLWQQRRRDFLAERTIGTDGRMHYTHPRPRAAYRSVRFYLSYLWICEYYSARCIPNTNAAIEGLNQRLKTLLRNHGGISSQRRMRLFEEYIAWHY